MSSRVTSPNMAVIRGILISDTADHGHQLMTDQQTALDAVIHTDWRVYRLAQDKILADLNAPNFAFASSYVDFSQCKSRFP